MDPKVIDSESDLLVPVQKKRKSSESSKPPKKNPLADHVINYKLNNAPPLFDFCLENNCFPERVGDRQHPSHLLLDGRLGGILKVPDHRNREFLARYAADVSAGEKLYLSEQRTSPYFKFFFELDYKRKVDSGIVADSLAQNFIFMVLEYCKSIQDMTRRYFASRLAPDLFDMILVKREPDVQRTDSNSWWSFGVHGYFPNLVVDQKEARLIRAGVIAHWLSQYGNLETVQNDWHLIYDGAVYLQNGLRMVGSRKMVPCPNCKGKPVPMCRVCRNNRKIDTDRRYTLWHVFPSHLKTKLQNDLRALIEKTSIRCCSQESLTPGFQVPAGSPQILDSAEDAIAFRNIRNKHDFRLDSEQEATLGAFLRQMVHPRYKALVIKGVLTDSRKSSFLIEVDGEGSCYCMNRDGEHRTNHVYFLLTEQAVYQKCFCRCETVVGRKYGKCKDFTSQAYPTTSQIQKMFFKQNSLLGYLSTTSVMDSVPESDSDVPKSLFELRNETLKRSNQKVHLRNVTRSILYLREWLKDAYEIRMGLKTESSFGSRKPAKKGSGLFAVTNSRQRHTDKHDKDGEPDQNFKDRKVRKPKRSRQGSDDEE